MRFDVHFADDYPPAIHGTETNPAIPEKKTARNFLWHLSLSLSVDGLGSEGIRGCR